MQLRLNIVFSKVPRYKFNVGLTIQRSLNNKQSYIHVFTIASRQPYTAETERSIDPYEYISTTVYSSPYHPLYTYIRARISLRMSLFPYMCMSTCLRARVSGLHVGEDGPVAKQPPSLERYLQAAVTVEAPALHIA